MVSASSNIIKLLFYANTTPKHLGAENIDIAVFLPISSASPASRAGVFQKEFPVPAIFCGHLRQQHTAAVILVYVKPLVSYDNFIN